MFDKTKRNEDRWEKQEKFMAENYAFLFDRALFGK